MSGINDLIGFAKQSVHYEHRARLRTAGVVGFYHTQAGLFTVRRDLSPLAAPQPTSAAVLVCSPIWVRDQDRNGTISIFDPRDRSRHVWVERNDPLAIMLAKLHSIGIAVEQGCTSALRLYLRSVIPQHYSGWTRIPANRRCNVAAEALGMAA